MAKNWLQRKREEYQKERYGIGEETPVAPKTETTPQESDEQRRARQMQEMLQQAEQELKKKKSKKQSSKSSPKLTRLAALHSKLEGKTF